MIPCRYACCAQYYHSFHTHMPILLVLILDEKIVNVVERVWTNNGSCTWSSWLKYRRHQTADILIQFLTKWANFFQIGTTIFLQKGLMALLYQSVMVPSCALVAYGWFLACHSILCTSRNLNVKTRIQTGGTA